MNKHGFWAMAALPLLLGCAGEGGTTGGRDYASSQTTPTPGDWVVEYVLNDPEDLNPLTHTSNVSRQASGPMHLSLLDFHEQTLKLVPILAKSRPSISADGRTFAFEIRPEAVWDNGTPITAHDVLFTFSAIKNPLTECQDLRSVLEGVQELIIDPANPRRFRVVTAEPNFLSEAAIGTTPILPRYHYDPKNLMQAFSLKQLNADAASAYPSLGQHPAIKEFAAFFNDLGFRKDPKKMNGGGPYRVLEWLPNQRLVLAKKPRHWTDVCPDTSLRCYPERIIFKVLKDQRAALAELRTGKLDVMTNLPPQEFESLKNDPKLRQHYAFYLVDQTNYGFIAFNNQPPPSRVGYFRDPKVREAFAHLYNSEQVVQNIYNGYARRIIGPVSPSLGGAYNHKLVPRAFDVAKARRLLQEAGWTDSDSNGVLDKVMGGIRRPLAPVLLVNAENAERMNMALLIQGHMKKAGIDLKIESLEFATYRERLIGGDFDLSIAALSSPPNGGDLKQVFHSQAIGGANFFRYASPKADSLLEAIRVCMNEPKREALLRELQEVLHRDVPVVFTETHKLKLAIHKRFRHAAPSPLRPGYHSMHFWTPREWVKYGTRAAEAP